MSASAHASFPFRDRQMQAKLPIPGAVTANSYLACTCADLDPEPSSALRSTHLMFDVSRLDIH
jgi:hypothetical protein